MERRSWDEKLNRLLPAFIVVYCVLQPLLDALGYWQQILEVGNGLTLAIRILLLSGSALLGVLLSERRRYYLILGGVLALLTVLHVAANLPGGYSGPLEDLSNLTRIYVLPITTLCFITFLRRGGERVNRAVKIGLTADLALILLIELLSVLTGTDRSTYVREHIGVIGWFVWGNCQSAILSMLTPLVICWSLNRWRERLLPIVLVTLAANAALYFFGTRLAFAALIASGFGVSVCLLLIDRRRWKQALAILLVVAAFTCAYPVSPAAQRLRSLADSNRRNEQNAQAQLASPTAEAPAAEPDAEPDRESNGELDWERLEAVYRYYCSAVVERFGVRRVAEKYNYSLDPVVLGDKRICKRLVCDMVMEEAPALCRFFGLNVNELRLTVGSGEYQADADLPQPEDESFEAENDFHGIYYVLGAVGLALLAVFLLYFGLRLLLWLLRNGKQAFTLQLTGLAGAYALGLIHAYFTTSVLRRNNASVYLALVLAGIWYLTEARPTGKAASAALPEEQTQERREDHGAE